MFNITVVRHIYSSTVRCASSTMTCAASALALSSSILALRGKSSNQTTSYKEQIKLNLDKLKKQQINKDN